MVRNAAVSELCGWTLIKSFCFSHLNILRQVQRLLCCPHFSDQSCLIMGRPWLSGESGSSNNLKVGSSIPTVTAQRLVNWQLEGGQSTSVPRPRCPWARHRTPLLPGCCDWLPNAPVYDSVSMSVWPCACVFNRCQPGWVKRRGVILCIYMTIKS